MACDQERRIYQTEASRILGVDREDTLAVHYESNILKDPPQPPSGGDAWIVSWSGSMAESLFESHPLTWMQAGHHALDAACQSIEPMLQADQRRWCFRPHARHVLSDPQSSLRFLDTHDLTHWGVALSPATMLERAMLVDAEEHIERAFSMLGERCSMVFLDDVRVAGEDLHLAPLGEGQLPMEVYRACLLRYVPPHTPLVFQAANLPEQLERLSLPRSADMMPAEDSP